MCSFADPVKKGYRFSLFKFSMMKCVYYTSTKIFFESFTDTFHFLSLFLRTLYLKSEVFN